MTDINKTNKKTNKKTSCLTKIKRFFRFIFKRTKCIDFNNRITWNDFLLQVDPFDLILFNTNNLVSKCIKIGQYVQTGSGGWSHVGVVINNKVIPDIDDNEKLTWYLYESNISNKKDIPNMLENKYGVHLRPLYDIIKKRGKNVIAWARLKHNPYSRYIIDEHDTMIDIDLDHDISTAMEILQKYNNREYDFNLCNLLGATFACCRPCRKNDNKLFCSELVGHIYGDLGIIDTNKYKPIDILPVDFISGQDMDHLEPPVELPPKFIDISSF
jgi:hypothetical protein